MSLHWKSRFIWSLCLPLLASSRSGYFETFDEELTVRALGDGKVASRFSFSTLLAGATPRNPQNLSVEDESQHYTLFPLALGQILREYAVTELHLTLNAGNWDYQRWGYPDEPDVGTGAQLWAWMGEGASTSVDARWRGLRNALAGLFCASLGALDEQLTTSPALAFAPQGALPAWSQPHAVRHAALAAEHVCTENLTPFLKLLPCKARAGIAQLLNPHRLFDADWHGMGLHVEWLPDTGVQVRLTFQSVTNPLRASSNRRDWSFSSTFDRTIDRKCPSASSSRILVTDPMNDGYRLTPTPWTYEGQQLTWTLDDPSLVGGNAVFDLIKQDVPLDVSMRWAVEFAHAARPPEAALSIQRSLHGASQAHGTVAVAIANAGPDTVRAAYLETMPWIVTFYLHTLELRVDGVLRPDLLQSLHYTPPVPHARATTLEAVLLLPPRSTLHLRVEVTKAFLRYTEHPPDAQRGWDLPPAVLVPLPFANSSALTANSTSVPSNANDVRSARRLYTRALLVDPATPDFSMPYNVVIFTCSVVAFVFGSVFNLLARRFAVVHAPVRGT
ncbi:Gpi16 subunit GPI transamidase component [Mycena belliarum]|uniref:Gpi16 subunit GPI transamidase component n=1 Tax=Mycena belliarum TaxID=1033014 RepID=A0AAD6XMT5_9AGAR|nr:Gpi16 subunit GPI transamidase component [Mycena belliae]